MSLVRARPAWLRPEAVDGLIAFAILVELQLEVWLDTVIPDAQRPRLAIAMVFLVAPILVRRRWPGWALVACAIVAAVLQAPPTGVAINGVTGTVLPVIVLAFTAGARLDPRRALASVMAASILIAGGAIWESTGPPTGYSLGSQLFAAVALPVIFGAFGRLWRERARRAARFHDLVASLERERARHEYAAAAQERVRIGRELQDIIAQNVSAIIIQAGGARQLIGVDAERAAGAILNVERAGREALADLRRTLGLLRTDGDPRELSPQPGLSQLDALLDSACDRGLDCVVRTEGDRGELAAGIDLVCYRVIEAALLGSDEHHRPTEVAVVFGQTQLGIDIRGRGTADGLEDQLRAISERVALYHGTLTIRPENAGGYTIGVQLPREVGSA